MTLALDIGNQRLKWGCWDGARFAPVGAFEWRGADGLNELADLAPGRIVACNVAGPEIAQQVDSFCSAQWGMTPAYLLSSKRCGDVTCAYDDPSELGTDRWAALLGAHALFRSDLCVIDCGTAATVDVITAAGKHLGGAIAPGLTAMRAALKRDAYHLTDSPASPAVLSRNTASAIQGGTLWGFAGAVERLIDEAEQLSGLRLDCILTGGDAQTLQSLFKREAQLQPHLVLHGLLVGLPA